MFFHCIIIEHIPECLVWWDSVSYVSNYPTLGHTPILEFIGSFADSLTTRSTSWSLWAVTLGHTPHPWVHQVFCVLSHCSIYLLTFVSCHTRAYPHPWVHWRFADFSHYSICFLIFASHHTGAYPLSRFSTGAYLPFFRFTGSHVDFMVVRPIFWSLWVIAEGIPLPSSCLGHPPIVIWFRASPFFQLYHHHGFSSLGF